MQADPTQGFGAERTAFPRRSRDLWPQYTILKSPHRQTLGHNLMNSLVDYWPMCETVVSAGFYLGIHGANHLTGAVNSRVLGNGGTFAINFTTAAMGVHRASNSTLQIGAGVSFTLGAWVNLTAAFAAGAFISKDDAASAREFSLRVSVAGAIIFNVGTGTTLPAGGALATAAGAVTSGNWFFAVGVYDAVTPLLSIYVNAGAPTTSTPTVTAGSSSAQLWVGGDQRAGGFSPTGSIQRVGYWKRALTSDEITYLYNNGVGRDYPFI